MKKNVKSKSSSSFKLKTDLPFLFTVDIFTVFQFLASISLATIYIYIFCMKIKIFMELGHMCMYLEQYIFMVHNTYFSRIRYLKRIFISMLY